MTKQENCVGVGEFKRGNRILARDVKLSRDGEIYIVEVGSRDYLETLGETEKDGYFQFDNLENIEDVCRELSSKSLEDLEPFLAPQAKNN